MNEKRQWYRKAAKIGGPLGAITSNRPRGDAKHPTILLYTCVCNPISKEDNRNATRVPLLMVIHVLREKRVRRA